ncbi:type II toxin-antitoxin system RelE/ParE family toxin [Photorhabdus heterorhabditis]|uniref:type II toxin-antitoxin system RelE/ParE family toxin n=1 Tax=Photorhabdus heterorhabditis TaxID=880156 RepID=UPI001562D782|nr:type II toxin-antitoxin system RelE/ParE family toxin [Photorhabdus heterorhabditis]NRN27964.1 hypothetical protein [Photorhabdus heterorhabditis subsp. aluminescens]
MNKEIVKPISFRDSSLDDFRAFPIDARREAGYQLDKVQHGEDPDNWKPMTSIGSGVREIRIKDAIGIIPNRFQDASRRQGSESPGA